MKERVSIGKGKNGGIFIWCYPEIDIVVFEWNEDYRWGAHYHVLDFNTGKHTIVHYSPTSMVPEPWNTLYFN